MCRSILRDNNAIDVGKGWLWTYNEADSFLGYLRQLNDSIQEQVIDFWIIILWEMILGLKIK
jgi:hypothetical protein